MQSTVVMPFSLCAISPEPWRNGRGVTRAIASAPKNANTGSFDYRLSIADIAENGPFSTFDGVDRLSLLLEGSTLTLFHEGKEWRTAGLLDAIQYDGGLPLHAYNGNIPARCLNVMTRKGTAKASLRVCDAISTIPATDLCMLLSLHDGCMVTAGDSSAIYKLDKYDGLLLERTDCSLRPAVPDTGHKTVVVSITRLAEQ